MPKKSSKTKKAEKSYRKANIPKAIREQCWVVTNGTYIKVLQKVRYLLLLIYHLHYHLFFLQK